MKKFWQFFKMNFENFLEYRTDFAISFIMKIIVFLGFVFLWKAIDNEGKHITKYGFSGLMFYYLITSILSGFASSRSARDLRTDILEGKLSTKLLKPLNVYSYFLARHWGRVVYETILNAMIVLPILIVWRDVSSEAFISFSAVGKFFIMSFLASLLVYNLYFLVGISAFWTKEAFGLQMIIRNMSRFFTGALIPLDLLPEWFQAITEKLPFGYMLYYPAKTLMEDIAMDDFYYAIKMTLAWISMFGVISYFIWKKGLQHYESVGI